MKHELKIFPTYFEAVMSGDKTFEIRKNNDRGFQKGDIAELKEWEPISQQIGGSIGGYTGKSISVKITYVTNFEQKEDYVVFGIRPVDIKQIDEPNA